MKEMIIYNIIAAAIAAAIIIPLASAEGSSYQLQQEAVYEAACRGGDKLRAVLSEGVNINTINDSGDTALMKAASENQYDVVSVLVNNGANVNMQNHKGETALIIAAGKGNSDVVCLLLEANADPNIRNRRGETALQKAEDSGHYDTAGLIGRSGGR